MEIATLKTLSQKDFDGINALYAEFAAGKRADEASVRALLTSSSEFLVLRDQEQIIGMATLNLLPRISRMDAEVNDVVVSEKYRGQGLGTLLMKAVITRAKELGVSKIHLTSRASRVAANALYQKLGFEQHETNVYQLKLR